MIHLKSTLSILLDLKIMKNVMSFQLNLIECLGSSFSFPLVYLGAGQS